MNTPQSFPLWANLAGEEYLVVGWSDYNVPHLVPVNRETNARAGVPKPESKITYSLYQEGFDLEQAIADRWAVIRLRDWKKDKIGHGMPKDDGLKEEDLLFEPFFAKDQPVNQGPRGIKLTHIPSGVSTSSSTKKSQLENKEVALKRLRSLTFLNTEGAEDDR